MNTRLSILSPAGRLYKALLLLIGFALLQAVPAFAATYIVHQGDTMQSVAKKLFVSPDALAAQNGLKAKDPLLAGKILTVPAPKPSPKTHALAKGQNKPLVSAKKPKKIRLSAKIAPVLDNRALLRTPVKTSALGLELPPVADTAEQPEGVVVRPVMRPAVELLTPKSTIGPRVPESGLAAPGLKATVRTGKETSVTGVVNAPGSLPGPGVTVPMLERDTNIGASAGVMLQTRF